MLAFRSLDPFRALREPDRRRRDEERLSRSEQRTLSKTQNNHLTGKAPYKFGHERLALVHRSDDPKVVETRWATSRSTRLCGMPPITSPPAVRAASAIAPISPMAAPP